jgi:hypothetical protein
MAKQIIVKDCNECDNLTKDSMYADSPWCCKFYAVKGEVPKTGIHPDCPLPDMPQYATGPWLSMSQAPKDGTVLLLMDEHSWYLTAAWKIDEWRTPSGQGLYETGLKLFAYINKPEAEK